MSRKMTTIVKDFVWEDGKFMIGDKIYCNGYGKTETVITTDMNISLPKSLVWFVCAANNGTQLRVFSMPLAEYNQLTPQPKAWKQNDTTVWFLATFKSVEGHLGTWLSKKTFGQMFEETISDLDTMLKFIAENHYCISFFMRHRENDLYNEMQNTHSYSIQNIVWDINHQRFMAGLLPPLGGVEMPNIIFGNLVPTSNDLYAIELHLQDANPVLLTIFENDKNIMSYKYITLHDELLRRFRCRMQNRFAALFMAERLSSQANHAVQVCKTKGGEVDVLQRTANELTLELSIARTELFTQQELDQYNRAVIAGKDELFNQISSKFYGEYVEFPPHMYRVGNMRTVLKEARSYEYARSKIWRTFCNSGNYHAFNEFLTRYCRLTVT